MPRTECASLARGETHKGVICHDADRQVHNHQHKDRFGRLALGENVDVR